MNARFLEREETYKELLDRYAKENTKLTQKLAMKNKKHDRWLNFIKECFDKDKEVLYCGPDLSINIIEESDIRVSCHEAKIKNKLSVSGCLLFFNDKGKEVANCWGKVIWKWGKNDKSALECEWYRFDVKELSLDKLKKKK